MLMRFSIALLALLTLAPVTSMADSVVERPGWSVHRTSHSYKDLIVRVKSAVKKEKLAVVTEAGPTGVAKSRGIDIPGNRVLGIYNNDFAVRVIRLSVPAMIEAPIRMYVTENLDGTATLSYKKPSHVFAPYFAEAPDLRDIASELDERFDRISQDAR